MLVQFQYSLVVTAYPHIRTLDNPVEVRVADLLKRMTLEEKIAQMQDLKFKRLLRRRKSRYSKNGLCTQRYELCLCIRFKTQRGTDAGEYVCD